MSTYLLRKVKYDYEIAKFEDSADPISVYSIRAGKCSCPSRYKACKHISVLKRWQSDGECLGYVYDDAGVLVNKLFDRPPLH